MKSKTFKLGDTVGYQKIIWKVEKESEQQLFLHSGKLTAWIFKNNRNLKLIKL